MRQRQRKRNTSDEVKVQVQIKTIKNTRRVDNKNKNTTQQKHSTTKTHKYKTYNKKNNLQPYEQIKSTFIHAQLTHTCSLGNTIEGAKSKGKQKKNENLTRAICAQHAKAENIWVFRPGNKQLFPPTNASGQYLRGGQQAQPEEEKNHPYQYYYQTKFIRKVFFWFDIVQK